MYEPMARLGIRRVLMPRSRYHVYYSIEEKFGIVRVHAVWHAARGVTPAF